MRTLVLNAGYEPLGVVSDRRALVLVLHGKANVIDVDEEHPVLGSSGVWERPRVIPTYGPAASTPGPTTDPSVVSPWMPCTVDA